MSPQGLRFLERWWLRGGIFLLPLAFLTQTYDSWVLPKVLLARVIVLGLVLLQLVRALSTGRLALKRTSLDVPLLLFLGSAAASTALAYNINTAVFGTYPRYDGLLTTATYLALFWLAVQSLDGPGDVRGLLRSLLAGGYVFGLLAIAGAIVDAVPGAPASPASATIGNPNVAGTFLAMVIPLALCELFTVASWTGRILVLNVIFVTGAALLITFSRSSWLGVAAASIVLLVGWRRLIPRVAPVAALSAVAAAVLLAGAGAGAGGFETSLGHRLASIVQPSDWGSRPHIWRDTLDLVSSRPIFGYGPDNFGLVYPSFQTGAWEISGAGSELQIDKAHAETLQIAATQGLVGLAAYLFVLFCHRPVLLAKRPGRAAGNASCRGGRLPVSPTAQLHPSGSRAAAHRRRGGYTNDDSLSRELPRDDRGGEPWPDGSPLHLLRPMSPGPRISLSRSPSLDLRPTTRPPTRAILRPTRRLPRFRQASADRPVIRTTARACGCPQDR